MFVSHPGELGKRFVLIPSTSSFALISHDTQSITLALPFDSRLHSSRSALSMTFTASSSPQASPTKASATRVYCLRSFLRQFKQFCKFRAPW